MAVLPCPPMRSSSVVNNTPLKAVGGVQGLPVVNAVCGRDSSVGMSKASLSPTLCSVILPEIVRMTGPFGAGIAASWEKAREGPAAKAAPAAPSPATTRRLPMLGRKIINPSLSAYYRQSSLGHRQHDTL